MKKVIQNLSFMSAVAISAFALSSCAATGAVLPTVKNPVAPSLAAQVMPPRAAARRAHVQLTAPRPAALSNKNIFEIRSSVHLLNRGMGAFFILCISKW